MCQFHAIWSRNNFLSKANSEYQVCGQLVWDHSWDQSDKNHLNNCLRWAMVMIYVLDTFFSKANVAYELLSSKETSRWPTMPQNFCVFCTRRKGHKTTKENQFLSSWEGKWLSQDCRGTWRNSSMNPSYVLTRSRKVRQPEHDQHSFKE